MLKRRENNCDIVAQLTDEPMFRWVKNRICRIWCYLRKYF